jgi:thioredoxin-like negative regulator of GroEL
VDASHGALVSKGEMMAMENWSPDQLKAALDSRQGVFLKLWKKGCGACKLSEPAIERVQGTEISAGLTFAQIQVDEFPEMLEIAETDVLPVFFVFEGGDMKGRLEGFKGIEKLKEFITSSRR